VKPQTLRTYEGLVRARIEPALGATKLSKLSAAQLSGFYGRLLDDGLAPASVRVVHAIIYKALRQAYRWGMIPTNPASVASVPKPRSAEVTPLTREQAKAFLAAAEGEPLEALFTLLLSTGLRVGEALGLRWSDINLDKGTAHIARTLWWAPGGKAQFGTPKSGKGRSIQLPPMAVASLRRHHTRQLEQRLAAPTWVESGSVFTNLIGEPLRRDHVDRHHFQPLLRKAGLPRHTLHVLRHTAATLLLQQGTHPTLVQHLLGHASVSMTLDKYSHWLPSMGEATA
jgi:integrase